MKNEYENLKSIRSYEELLDFLYMLHNDPKTHSVKYFETHDNVFNRIFFILTKECPFKWVSGKYVIELEHQYGVLILIKQ